MGVLRSANGTAAFFNPCQILVYVREVKSCVTLSICEVTGNTVSIKTLPGLSQAFLSSLHTSPFEQFILVLTPPEQTRYPVVLCGSAKVPSSSGHSVLSGKDHQESMKNFHPSRNVINASSLLNQERQ